MTNNNKINSLTKAEKASKNIYCISGLGADRRVFRNLKFVGYQLVHLDWLAPNKQEKLSDYAKRLAEAIEDKEPILIGLSFGGMVAVEIAKQIKVKQVILISSAKQADEIPWYIKLFRWLPIHCFIPIKSLLWTVYWLINWFFGIETVEERKLLKEILVDTDAKFLKWAINRVVFWKNEITPKNIYHIHGTSDRIFPMAFVKPDITLEKGGHLMVVNRADPLAKIIYRLISKTN
ncbi:MAG: alpha/beta hydrolase [Xenococcaceae cyanobacterium]